MSLNKKQRENRKVRNIGLEIKPPSVTCNDKLCPWHGDLSLRGKIFIGTVLSTKAKKTAVIRRDFIKFIPKYERYARVHGRLSVYRPDCIEVKKGDKVKIMECRPLSKTKTFAIIEVFK